MSGKTEDMEVKKSHAFVIASVAAFVLVAGALIVCIILLLKRQDNVDLPGREAVTGNGGTAAVLERGFVDAEDTSAVVTEMQDKVEEGMFECSMTTTWSFDNAEAVSPNAYVANVESNRHTLYFDVYLDGEEEAVYSSPLLPVGTELQGIKLDRAVLAGDYDATVVYTLVDEDYEEVSAVGFKIKLYMAH